MDFSTCYRVGFVALLVGLLAQPARSWAADSPYVPPPSPRITFNFNLDWRFVRQDVPGAEASGFDDSKWETISTPPTFNDVDSFRTIISHSGGDRGGYTGIGWYRKHFKLPAEFAGRKIFLEFEGMRQAGRFYVNGKEAGLYENGVTAYGLDISTLVNFGDAENVLAVKIDNRTNYQEESSHTVFEWESRDFNPDFGGITRRVWLQVAGKIYQTLPLFDGLQTSGVYIYPTNISVSDRSADVNVEAQVRNESGDQASITLSAVVVDADGKACSSFDGDTIDMVDGERTIFKATGHLASANL